MSQLILCRRSFCCGLAAGALFVPARAAPPQGGRFDAVVDRQGGTHRTLASALAAAPNNDRPYRIRLGPGRWEEKVTVSRPHVTIVGDSVLSTMLTSAFASGHEKPGGGKRGTYGSATLTVEAPGFTLSDLMVENGFDYVANIRTRSVADAQAVALALGNQADRTLIERVALMGHQDTFYLRAGRALVRDCLITGSIDFIFGGAAARFEGCDIRSRHRPGETLQGYVAAPSTHRDQKAGLVFQGCQLKRDRGVPDGTVWLGRPWRAGGNTALRGAAAYLDCWMDAHIHPEGWTWMGYRLPDGTQMRFEPGDARFFELRSRGPGARRGPTRPQITPEEAEARYSRTAMFGDWRP
jgi:pectinesterase